MANYLAIDFGFRYLGLAVNIGNLAEPLTTIDRKISQQLILKLSRLCQQHQIDSLIIGISEGRMAQKSRQFGKWLQAELKLPIIFFDETLSTWEAERLLIEAKKSLKKKKQMIHQVAATVILQSFLDDKHKNLVN